MKNLPPLSRLHRYQSSTAKLRIWTLRTWCFRGPGFCSARQVLCGDASRLFLDHFSEHLLESSFIWKNPHAHKNQIGTSTRGFSSRKSQKMPGAHKIGAAISGPRIRVEFFWTSRFFWFMGRTELCHEARNPRPQEPQITRNENHHLALFTPSQARNPRSLFCYLCCRKN